MEFHDLTAEQCNALREQIGPHRSYFRKLEERMLALGWKRDDELFLLVEQATRASDKMWISLHYRACDIHRKERPPTIGLNGTEP